MSQNAARIASRDSVVEHEKSALNKEASMGILAVSPREIQIWKVSRTQSLYLELLD